jgi:protein-arginine kinase activator protein McsA
MEESQRMVTIMLSSASILNYHFLCVLCSHIEKESTSNVCKLCHHSLKKFLSYGRLHTHHFYSMSIYMLETIVKPHGMLYTIHPIIAMF